MEVVTALLADKGLDKIKNVAKTGKTADNVADIAEGAGKAAENAAEDAAKAGKELEGAAKGAESAAEDAGKAGKTAGKVGESGSGSVPNSLLQGDPNTRVYLGIIDGEPDYVGIAYDVERRQSQHGDRFDYLREITTEPLTRRQARAIEQAMIKNHLEYSNKINSISTKRDWYNDAVTWGEAWLREHGLLE